MGRPPSDLDDYLDWQEAHEDTHGLAVRACKNNGILSYYLKGASRQICFTD